jgi:hypothetical protein
MAGITDGQENYCAVALDPDDAFNAISNSRRRRVLLSLDRSDGPSSAGDLAVELAAIENGIEPSAVTSTQRTNVYVALTQVHLDKLAEIGAVKYDARSKQVAATDATAGLAEIIRRTESSCYSPEPEADGDDGEECL